MGLDLLSDGTYGELTNGQVLHLQSYVRQWGCDLHQVGKDGNCLFNAVRQCIAVSLPYFKSRHLWQQMVQFAIEGQYFLIPTVMPQIQGLYGNSDFFFPVTFKEYLQYMLEDGVWGDQVALYLIARMWNMKISILVAGGWQVTVEIYKVPLHHQGGMVEADIVVAFNGHGHYSPVVCNDKTLVSAAKCTWYEDD